MKHSKTKEDINHFLEEMGDRLNAIRQSVCIWREENRRSTLPTFKLPRTQYENKVLSDGFFADKCILRYRRNILVVDRKPQREIGLRMAIGSSKYSLYKYMNLEGICLFSFTLPFIILFMLNMAYFDIMDTIRLPLSLWRFCITIGSAWLLLAGMITLGIWIPARKATNLAPAEALHYE